MPAYNANFEIALPADLLRGASASAAIRAAIGLPVDLRSQGVRLVMFSGAALLARDESMLKAAEISFRRAIEGYETLLAMLKDNRRQDQLHPDAAFVIATGLKAVPAAIAAFDRLLDRARHVGRSLDRGGRPDHDDYDSLIRIGYTEVHPAALALGEAMNEGGRILRNDLAEAAEAAQRRASAARGRINAITRTIRMISLNARVEATRTGPAGRAFGIIAEEIRTLSEQTEVANTEMRESLEQIMANLRAL